MKKARKLLVALLVLTFLLGTFNVGFVAAADEKLPSHVVRAIALGYLKGFEDGDLRLDQPITRAQALAFIIRISGLEASAELMKGQTQFADVNNDPSLQWATGYINLGVGQGIINGYPDGTFKGNNNVTYAEMAKMLLYAMNYGVTVEGGIWPAAVMGKADDLNLFDKVNAVPNVPALRGDVVKMIDNSLTIKHLVQKGYGDLAYYDEGTDTFLSKMKVTELEDVRVTAVDPKKAKITIAKKSYKVLADVDVESLLGMEVTAWVNDDDEIFFIDPDYDAVKIDIVKENVAKDATKIKLKLADASYKIADNVNVYINGETADLDDLKAGYYGYFVFNDDDQILYINVKYWNEVNAGVVTEVDTKNNIIHYFLLDDNDNELDLDEPDDGYVITLDGEKIDLEDIEVNDVIYVAEYDDMYHVVVVRNSV
ncbi:MAG: S-layer homology domain-containing protein, partial [Tepidanaerobacteraceae bacterium]